MILNLGILNLEKNRVLYDFDKICETINRSPIVSLNTKDRIQFEKFHLYEIEIKGEPSWLNIRFVKGETYPQIYTITDKIKSD